MARSRAAQAAPSLLLLLLLPILLAAAAPSPSPSAPPAAEKAQGGGDPFAAAPRCPSWPRASTSTRDREGRLWGFSQGASCAYKSAAAGGGQPLQLEAWETAFACGDSPAPTSSTADQLGRLWGWDDKWRRSCAYKDGGGRPRFYDTYEPGSWLSAPPCPGAQAGGAAVFDDLAVTDSQFKTWSWGGFTDGLRLCAFKDDRQAPLPPDPSEYLRLSFLDAPACGGSEASPDEQPGPQTARPDRDGVLWGWWRGRPCAWKRVTRVPETGRVASVTPVYYEAFSGARSSGGGPATPAPAAGPGVVGASPAPPPGGRARQQEQVEVPPVDSTYRYARRDSGGAGGEGPTASPSPSPSPAP